MDNLMSIRIPWLLAGLIDNNNIWLFKHIVQLRTVQKPLSLIFASKTEFWKELQDLKVIKDLIAWKLLTTYDGDVGSILELANLQSAATRSQIWPHNQFSSLCPAAMSVVVVKPTTS